MTRALAAAALLLLGACTSLGDDLPTEAPRLVDMDEPLQLREEPKDEAERLALAPGAFTGITVGEARTTLEEGLESGGAAGVRVQKVIENSPADAAGIVEDDLLLEVRVDGGEPRTLRWPGDWRKAELDATPGGMVSVLVDRAGVELRADLEVVARVHPASRGAVARYREESRVGVVVRTATEVEARTADLGPGGGAVVVGLSRASPWRAAGIRFGDLIASAGGEAVAHPQALLEAIRNAPEDGRLALDVVRDGQRLAIDAPLTVREQELREFHIPLLWSHESGRGVSETSVLLGLIKTRSTAAAWEWRLLWFITFGGGDSDRLEEIEE